MEEVNGNLYVKKRHTISRGFMWIQYGPSPAFPTSAVLLRTPCILYERVVLTLVPSSCPLFSRLKDDDKNSNNLTEGHFWSFLLNPSSPTHSAISLILPVTFALHLPPRPSKYNHCWILILKGNLNMTKGKKRSFLLIRACFCSTLNYTVKSFSEVGEIPGGFTLR